MHRLSRVVPLCQSSLSLFRKACPAGQAKNARLGRVAHPLGHLETVLPQTSVCSASRRCHTRLGWCAGDHSIATVLAEPTKDVHPEVANREDAGIQGGEEITSQGG